MPLNKIQTAKRIKIVHDYWQKKGIMPTILEMTNLFGMKHTNSAYQFIQRMIRIGIFVKVGSRFAPGPKFFE